MVQGSVCTLASECDISSKDSGWHACQASPRLQPDAQSHLVTIYAMTVFSSVFLFYLLLCSVQAHTMLPWRHPNPPMQASQPYQASAY